MYVVRKQPFLKAPSDLAEYDTETKKQQHKILNNKY